MIAREPPAVHALRLALADPADTTAVLDDAGAIRLALWMIEGTLPWPGAARSVLADAVALHRRDAPAGDDGWRRLQKAAVALDADPDSAVVRAGALAEAASWPIAGSRASLIEIYRAALFIHVRRAVEATGWTEADEERAEALLSRLANSGAERVPERHEIPDLFAAADPVTERRFVAQLAAANDATATFARMVSAFE